jgi:hypothetical protein
MGKLTKQQTSKELKLIIDALDYSKMVNFTGSPVVGEYYITGIQAGPENLNLRVGYVAQVRKRAGCFGSDIVLIRHPNGCLGVHENQSYFSMDKYWKDKLKELYPTDMTPEKYEDYSEPYTLVGGKYPEKGKVIEPPPDNQSKGGMPMMKITTIKADGSKELTVC